MINKLGNGNIEINGKVLTSAELSELIEFNNAKNTNKGITEDVFSENDFIVEYFNGDVWNGRFARIVSIDRQNGVVSLDRYMTYASGLAFCAKFFHTPLQSPFQFPLSVLQNGLKPDTSYTLANRKQLQTCCKALNKTKELVESRDYAKFFSVSHLSSDVLDWHISEFSDSNSITNETLEILNLLIKKGKK